MKPGPGAFGLPRDAPLQAVIIPGLRGMRPGEDPAASLRDVAGRPFLDYLIEDAVRFGFHDLLLLAPAATDAFERYAAAARTSLRRGVMLRVAARDLRQSIDDLQPSFLLLDADSHFDFNWLDLVLGLGAGGAIAACARGADHAAGVYLVDRAVFAQLAMDALTAQATRRDYDGAFADARSGQGLAQLPRRRQRPAVFFDRDGTINVEVGYAHRPEQLAFLPGAVAAVKRVNDAGYYAFLVTNQSGVARGYFGEAEVEAFHARLQRALRAAGAHFDDIRYCPYLADASVPAYRRDSDWRKPAPGMFLDLMRHWPVAAGKSLAIGDQDRDVEAAEAAGVRAVLYPGGDLDAVVARHLNPPPR